MRRREKVYEVQTIRAVFGDVGPIRMYSLVGPTSNSSENTRREFVVRTFYKLIVRELFPQL